MTTADTLSAGKRRNTEPGRLSKDGQWRSFPKVPNLIQYVPNGSYYARIKVGGKVIRRTLGTATFSTARLKLLDFLREQKQPVQSVGETMSFRAARELFERRLKDDRTIKSASMEYRLLCIGKLTSTWPGLDDRKADDITPDDCRQWAAKLTHHDLRHLFATRCIESGVDIPTVARWLGHKDGGALAMKVDGHLRNQHSQEMAKKVRF